MTSHPVAPYARTAYAQGVAASGGPITDRVKAGCIAAVAEACEHADDPHVIEVTLQLGKLEGTWAAVFDRRLKRHADNDAALAAAWTSMLDGAAYGSVISTVRQHFGLTEAAGPVLRSAADWIASRIRQLLDSTISGVKWFQLRQAVRAAIATATAEGRVGALALGANQQAIIGFDFDLAFDHAYDALGNINSLVRDSDVDAWLSNLLADTADDAGLRLASMIRDSASRADMIDALSELLGNGESKAITSAFDLLTSRAMSQGALDLYASEGVARVDFMTAGDDRVCNSPCYEAEQSNPYLLANAPQPGLHPLCRCCLAAVDPLPYSTVAPYAGDDALD